MIGRLVVPRLLNKRDEVRAIAGCVFVVGLPKASGLVVSLQEPFHRLPPIAPPLPSREGDEERAIHVDTYSKLFASRGFQDFSFTCSGEGKQFFVCHDFSL